MIACLPVVLGGRRSSFSLSTGAGADGSRSDRLACWVLRTCGRQCCAWPVEADLPSCVAAAILGQTGP